MKRPDEKILKRWLEGELEGDELTAVEKWAESSAGDLDEEFKCQIGWDALSDDMMANVPESIEPPYPEFFNNRIEHAISEGTTGPYGAGKYESLWQKFRLMLAPVAVAALVAFYAGTQMQSQKQDIDPADATDIADVDIDRIPDEIPDETPDKIPDEVPDVNPDSKTKIAAKDGSVYLPYVPSSGIMAAVSESEDATEIILDGLAPISDELDIAAGETSPGRSPMMTKTHEEKTPRRFF